MEPGGSMPYSQWLSNNPILSRIKQIPRIDTHLILSSNLRLGLPKGTFPVGLSDKILETVLISSVLTT